MICLLLYRCTSSGVLQKPPLPEIEGTGKDENETKEGTHDFFPLHSLNQINLSNLILNEYFSCWNEIIFVIVIFINVSKSLKHF